MVLTFHNQTLPAAWHGLLGIDCQPPPLPLVTLAGERSSSRGGASILTTLLLTATTLITTPIALQHHWHIHGLWLILTPFLVLRPFVRDAWRVALHRSLGTLAGVALVILVAPALPHTLPLQVPAIALAAVTAGNCQER